MPKKGHTVPLPAPTTLRTRRLRGRRRQGIICVTIPLHIAEVGDSLGLVRTPVAEKETHAHSTALSVAIFNRRARGFSACRSVSRSDIVFPETDPPQPTVLREQPINRGLPEVAVKPRRAIQ